MTDINLQAYCGRAVKRGTIDAKQIHPSSVVTATWVRLKFQFDCANNNKYILLLPSLHSHTDRGRVVSAVESMAFYDGYYLSMGFAAGSCKQTLCYKFPNCQALEGKGCPTPNIPRPSMEEAVGLDAYQMAAKLGWEIYPLEEITLQRAFRMEL